MKRFSTDDVDTAAFGPPVERSSTRLGARAWHCSYQPAVRYSTRLPMRGFLNRSK